MPLGPSEDRKVRATVRAAKMFDFWASRPLMRFLFAPSCEREDAAGARRDARRERQHTERAAIAEIAD